ncbi:hypothetical protein MASR2M79_11560 [Aminivibrio sp.]
MILRKFDEVDVMKNPHGVDARNIYDAESAVLTVITLKPGEQLKPHKTPVDVAFFVLEGKGTVEIGDEKQEAEKDTLVESPMNITHCWYNTGTEDLRFLVLKAPRPGRKTVFAGN